MRFDRCIFIHLIRRSGLKLLNVQTGLLRMHKDTVASLTTTHVTTISTTTSIPATVTTLLLRLQLLLLLRLLLMLLWTRKIKNTNTNIITSNITATT